MKKAIIHISITMLFVIIYLIQTTLFTNLTIAGVMPNILIILMLYIGLYMGRSIGAIYGIIFGIFIDLWIGKNLGITSVALAGIGILGGIFDKNFSKDSRITVLLMGAICTIIYEVAIILIQNILIGLNLEVIEFIKILAIEVIYNVILISILYPIMKITGYEVENEVKGDKILTRYF